MQDYYADYYSHMKMTPILVHNMMVSNMKNELSRQKAGRSEITKVFLYDLGRHAPPARQQACARSLLLCKLVNRLAPGRGLLKRGVLQYRLKELHKGEDNDIRGL